MQFIQTKGTLLFILKSIIFIFLAGCVKEDPDIPPLKKLDPGTIITIEDLRDMYTGLPVKFTDEFHFNIFAVVSMAEESGNIYRAAYIQDHTGALNLRMRFPEQLNQGDSVRLNLKGTILSDYNQMLQLDSVDADVNVVKQASGKLILPMPVTIPQILSGDYQARLVMLDNVQFVENNLNMKIGDAEGLTTVNRYIEDCQGRRLIVRTSGYANFAAEPVPQGNGSMVAIVGQFGSDWQLYIRSFEEVQMENERCEIGSDIDFEPNATISQLKALYNFSQEFITIQDDLILDATVTANDRSGNFYRQIIIQDETGGIELKINQNDLYTLYNAGQRVYIKTQGLILGQYGGIVQLGGTTYLSGENLRLGGIESNSLSNHVYRVPGGETIQPTEILLGSNLDALIYSFVELKDVQFAESQLGFTFASPSQTTNRTLTDCAGRTIIVRTSNFADYSGNYLPEGRGSIKAVLSKFNNDYQLLINEISDLELTQERCEIDTGESGTGTFADPFNVTYAINNNSGNNVWVEGYITGVMETNVNPFVPSFNPPFATNSNIIIAESADETDLGKSLIVQLPAGDVRTALNLVNNSDKRGVYVKLRGNLATYFSQPGMRETSAYWLEGMPVDIKETVFEEAFTSNLGVFTNHNILGQQNWEHRTFDGGCAYINGYASGQNNANENWLVSPQINLTGKTNTKLQIREAINFITNYNDLKVLVSSDYNGSNPAESGNWTELTGFTRPAGNNWTFLDSGDIDISVFDGETVNIAFKYTSTNTGASGWEISRIRVTVQE